MASAGDSFTSLDARAVEIGATIPDGALAVSVYDYLSGFHWQHNGGRWFHAASTIKLAILAAVFDAIDAGRFTANSRVHVRNRFISVVEGRPFRVHPGRDADGAVYGALGRTMRIGDLAHHMIATSSNLATNLLLDVVGLEPARQTLARRGLEGIDLQRGVEDERAFEAGCNNRVTADGVVRLLQAIRDANGFSAASSSAMLDMLFDQQFSGGIAPGLPDAVRAIARVAHKTGDISTVSHDAGLVFLHGRPPYVVAILTESSGEAADRTAALTAVSRAAYDAVAAEGETACR
jgi:beta-lactamase class A